MKEINVGFPPLEKKTFEVKNGAFVLRSFFAFYSFLTA